MQVYYTPSFKENVKVKFKGLDLIKESYSNLCQDMFVLSVLNGKSNGTYLEIGGHLPIVGNNTYILENLYNWKGISIEFDQQYQSMWTEQRKNPIYIQDALTTDYTGLLTKNGIGEIVDYLSCDIEPQDATFAALKKIDHSKYRFRVITFEHDHYNGGAGPMVREESRKFLSDLGYRMLVGDVSHQGNKIEDWWVDPNLVDLEISNALQMTETWNADEAIYLNPVSRTLKNNSRFIYSIDQGSISLL
jgi:hypothetical protein